MATPGFAVQPDEVLDDPVLEQRARDLSTGLRCLVCRNESIDESNADLARDLRLLLRERLVAGDTDEAGDFLYRRSLWRICIAETDGYFGIEPDAVAGRSDHAADCRRMGWSFLRKRSQAKFRRRANDTLSDAEERTAAPDSWKTDPAVPLPLRPAI